jgi:hypothetical protein
VDSEEGTEVQGVVGMQHVTLAEGDAGEVDLLVSERRLSEAGGEEGPAQSRDAAAQQKQAEYDALKWSTWPEIETPGADSRRTAQAMVDASKEVPKDHKCANYTWERAESDKKKTGFRREYLHILQRCIIFVRSENEANQTRWMCGHSENKDAVSQIVDRD